jgi:hypothetical protein
MRRRAINRVINALHRPKERDRSRVYSHMPSQIILRRCIREEMIVLCRDDQDRGVNPGANR